MPNPRITVAVITYNRAPFLRETLAGLSRQEYTGDEWELLVIDNNSTDDTADVVASFGGSNPAPRRILETAPGLDHGRNRAIREARGELVALVDDDILMDPDWLSLIMAPLASDAKGAIGAVGGDVVPVFPGGVPRWLEGSHRPLNLRGDTGPLRPGQSPMGANFAFPKRVFAQVGEFDTRLDRSGKKLFGGGDSDMIRRVRAAGLEVWFVPAARVQHQIPAGRLTFSYAARHAFDSARSSIVEKGRALAESGRAAAPYLASRLLGALAKLAWFCLQAAACFIFLATGAGKRALVRAWRCCGYIYQIARSMAGKV
ncbi:MAG TPA: glycosyltransferase [Opitutaceae bacterium]|jgi:glycosyltransferase involved in cell wall biosynthesis